ncbi:M2 family metallopeptidase [Maricaulis salignorans]|uniref:Peptidyl-dipeptidase A n=1 Tax=Maricaulis salignorans TaxID=144026 RepID=A0A1G9P4E7_9PROT|nr:M2 family metallopeptidase [Maricaulis salignorans]SDL93423.1 peptidyl-dipeptidase A [Maricaulis salignorans]
MTKLLAGVAVGALLAAGGYYAYGNSQDGAVTADETVMTETAPVAAGSVEDAASFLAETEAEIADFGEFAAHTAWVYANFITEDTEYLVSRMSAEATELSVQQAGATARFADTELPLDMRRKMTMLTAGITLPTPAGGDYAQRLAELTTRMSSAYSTGTIDIDDTPVTLDTLEVMMGTERDPEFLAMMWNDWRAAINPAQMSQDYAAMVEIANAGARELGFSDLAEMWLSNYDMPADEMEAEVERLWGQVEPLYEQLHCYVRDGLNETYGEDVQATTGPIRADLLGNMWAQGWAPINDIVGIQSSDGGGYDLTQLLEANDYTPRQMVETGERFYTSLGLDPLPETFWERSLITRPRDRDVVCHASAWNLDNEEDIRIKMCTHVNAEDFRTVHHELGHNFYQRAYRGQDMLFRNGAHDGFHEAIGDFVALSVTPDYLVQIGLLDQDEVPDESADLGLMMDLALDKIAFLPFAVMMDQWRWRVFRGEITPDQYNTAWWELREQYQGLMPPVDRPADAFDPGAKYHIANNVPYLRYFLSYILQFQFQQAACDMAGWEGPLNRCTVYGNEEVGQRFNEMMEMGASQPWPDALEAFTGTREMDGSAIIAYFQPLMTHLEEQNTGSSCGWE